MWSYGVVIWEIYTQGETPYSDMTNEQVYMEVELGFRLPKPEGCPNDLFDLMTQMWDADTAKRSSFCSIVADLKKLFGHNDEPPPPEEKAGLMGLSAYHIINVAKKFMKVTKAMTTTDVLGRMKKILKNEHTSYCKTIALTLHDI